jgi:hypothetical protein
MRSCTVPTPPPLSAVVHPLTDTTSAQHATFHFSISSLPARENITAIALMQRSQVVMRPLPPWAHVLLGVDRYVQRGIRGYEVLRDQLLLGQLDSSLHATLTARAYANERAAYLPGGARFEAGLFDWEATVLARIGLPQRARILLGAAGGGRELAALLSMGHDVVAFEPNDALLAGANAVSAQGRGSAVIRASLEHLIDAVEGAGPLAGINGPFDLVLLGWVSLSHITEPATQISLFRALRRLYPGAPVVTSFLVRSAELGSSRPRGFLWRNTLRALASKKVSPSLAYMPRAGVIHRFSRDEIGRLASETGYTVRLMDTTRDGYAVFQPVDEA